jgi:hypothetical protein
MRGRDRGSNVLIREAGDDFRAPPDVAPVRSSKAGFGKSGRQLVSNNSRFRTPPTASGDTRTPGNGAVPAARGASP